MIEILFAIAGLVVGYLARHIINYVFGDGFPNKHIIEAMYNSRTDILTVVYNDYSEYHYTRFYEKWYSYPANNAVSDSFGKELENYYSYIIKYNCNWKALV
jgi:hypothetical protein